MPPRKQIDVLIQAIGFIDGHGGGVALVTDLQRVALAIKAAQLKHVPKGRVPR